MDRRMDIEGGRRGRRWAGMAAAVATLLVAGAAVAGAASPGVSPQVLPGEPNVPWDDGATVAEPRTDLVDVGPRTWEHVLLAPDGRTATVYFWMGPAACEGLADIDVRPTDTGYRLLVMTGQVPGADVCTDIVQLYRSVVALDDRIISGGSLLDLPGGSVAVGA